MNPEFLTPDDVASINVSIVGGLGIRDRGLLDSAVMRVQATVFGEYAYPTVTAMASALFESLARNHPFVDGNKRTAWRSAWVFLALNGVELVDPLDVDTAERLVQDLAQGVITNEEVGARLLVHAADTETKEEPCWTTR